jgi:ubiquinone/menaquinone biosynthesis C-methylase UbiE
LAYDPRPDAFVVGVDPSAKALRGNRRLNLRVHTSAVRLPIASESVDLLICFYSLHHMIGTSVKETRTNVTECLSECARVLTPEGVLFIAENNPRTLFWFLQRWGWTGAKRLLGRHLDMFFWSRRELDRLLMEATGRHATRMVSCDTGPLTVLSPLFAAPQFKVFRFLHPLDCSVSIWQKESSSGFAT